MSFLHVPWKKVGNGVLHALEAAAVSGEPHAVALVGFIHVAEGLFPHGNGPKKLALVNELGDAVLNVLPIPDQAKVEIRAARTLTVNAYVAAKTAEAESEAAYNAYRVVLARYGIGVSQAQEGATLAAQSGEVLP